MNFQAIRINSWLELSSLFSCCIIEISFFFIFLLLCKIINKVKQMRSQRLPDIQKPSNPQTAENSTERGGFSYYKALKDLKDVTKKVTVVKNRLSYLILKQHEADNPIAAYYQDKQIRLRTLANEYQDRLQAELSVKRMKSQSEIQLKRKSNELMKKETFGRIEKSRKMLTEEKFQNHDQIRTKSKQNLMAIEQFKRSFLIEKQSRRNMLYRNEKRQKELFEDIQLKKIQQVRAECERQTKNICQKIKEREDELRQIEQQCEKFEASQQERMLRHRQRKLEKIKQHRKVLTIDTRFTIKNENTSQSTSPSYMSFVVIS